MADDQEDDHYAGVSFGDFGTYIRHKKRKLQDQLDQLAAKAPKDLPQIFEGVVFYINGFTVPPIHVSKSQITHIIAMNLTQAKMNEFKNYKVVRPEWILDSIKAGMRLPWHRYSVLRVAGSLQQFGTRLVAPASQPGQSLIRDNNEIPSSSLQGGTLTFRPNETDLVPSAPKYSPASSLSTLPLPPPPPNLSSDELGSDDNEIEMMPGDEDMEWADIDFVELEEPLSLSPADPRRSQPMPSGVDRGDDPNADRSLHQDSESTEPYQQLPSSTAFTGTAGPGSNVGFKLIRTRKPHIIPSPIGSLEGETDESFADLSFAEDTRPPIEDGEEREVDDDTAGQRGQHEASSAAVSTNSSSTVDPRHPTLIELSNAWNRKNSSVEPGFVAKFFQSSRLHYLSTWKAKLREMMAGIQKKDQKTTKVKPHQQSIMHVDFDCFFASVGTRDRPELAGKPVGVAHGSGGTNSNSEIASCNYLARGFGVKNGMQLKKARSLCPELVVVPYEFEKYETISLEFYRILLQYADDLQAVSVDEALVDISSRVLPTWNDHGKTPDATPSWPGTTQDTRIPPEEFAQKLRDEIFAATGCQASVGIGPNVLLAKLSTKRAKPHGQYIWPSAPGSDRTILELQGDDGEGSQATEGEGLGMADVSLFVSPPASSTPTSNEANATQISPPSSSSAMPPPPTGIMAPSPRPKKPHRGVNKGNSIKLLPGVGYRTAQELEERFLVKTIFELQQVERAKLQEYCGMKTGDMLYKACRGIDDTEITADLDKKRQSVSAEISWGVRFENEEQVERFVQDLSVEVSRRLRDIGRKAKSLVMKIMKRKQYTQGAWKHLGHGPVDQFARTGQLPNYTDDPETIAEEAMRLIHYFKFSPLDLRGIGIQMVKLDHGPQGMFSKQRIANEQKKLNPGRLLQQQEETEELVARAESSTAGLNMVGTGHQQSDRQQQQNSAIPLRPPSPPPLPEMEIDRATFEELPVDIQQDLSRHHQLKFLSQRAEGSSTSHHARDEAVPPAADGNKDEAIAGSSSPSAHSTTPDRPSLPPWSQLDPDALRAMSTPMIRKTLELYADDPRRRVVTQDDHATAGDEGKMEEENGDEENTLAAAEIPGPWGPPVTNTTPVRRRSLDLSVLKELPEDIRAEIEQEYNAMQENQRLIALLAAGEGGRGESSAALSASELRRGEDGAAGAGVKMGKATFSMATIASSSTSVATTGRRRGRPPGSKTKKHGSEDATAGGAKTASRSISTTNAVNEASHHGQRLSPRPEDEADDEAGDEEEGKDSDSGLPPPPPPLDSDFLEALPPDLRAEIEANYRAELARYRQQLQQRKRDRKAKTKGLTAAAGNIGDNGDASHLAKLTTDPQHSSTRTDTDARPLRPTLNGEREIGPLRQMVTLWVQSTLVAMTVQDHETFGYANDPAKNDAATAATTPVVDSETRAVAVQVDKGPNPEDVNDFIEFLVRVVAVERDLDRVRLLVRWLQRKVAESEANLAECHHQVQQWWRQQRLLVGQQEKSERDEDEDPNTSVSSNSSMLAMLLYPTSQPAMTWRQALTRIETAVQGVVRQMYGGTVDLIS
ncbi:deoxycytidyl transferase [Actinomortierella ambigua]|nr:deoxycytidyl transferase [Actinomortierella ambigua]